MRLLNFLDLDGPAVALFLEGRWVNLSAADDSMPTNVQDMLVAEKLEIKKLAILAARAPQLEKQPTLVLPPVFAPQKILCVGLNYRAHAEETGQPVPAEPLIPQEWDLSAKPRYLGRRLGLPDGQGGYQDAFVVRRIREGALQIQVNVSSDLITDDEQRNRIENSAPIRLKMSSIYQLPSHHIQ